MALVFMARHNDFLQTSVVNVVVVVVVVPFDDSGDDEVGSEHVDDGDDDECGSGLTKGTETHTLT